MESLWWIFFLAGLTLCLIWLCAYGRYVIRNLILASKLPGPSMWELITVHLKELWGKNLVTHVWKMCISYGHRPWCGLTFYGYAVGISDCESVSEMCKTKSASDRTGLFLKEVTKYLGKTVITLNEPEHRQHRKIITPLFRKSYLESNLPLFNAEAAILVQLLREKANGEITDVRHLVRDQVAVLVFSLLSPGKNQYHNIIRNVCPAIKATLSEVHCEALNPIYYWFVHKLKKSTIEKEQEINRMFESIKKIVDELYHSALHRLDAKEDTMPLDPIQVMVQGFSNLGGVDVLKTVKSEAIEYFLAGQETTAFVTNVALLMLALHPDVQQRVFQEMDSIFGSTDRAVEPQDLSKMVYLEMVIKETLRLFPPLPMFGRCLGEDTCISGVSVPKRTYVGVITLALHRNPEIFENPLKFDPERFSQESSKGRHPYAYLPFGIGSRICVGQVQAMITLKTFLCHIVRHFEILPGDGLRSIDDVKYTMTLTLNLKESPLRLVQRDISCLLLNQRPDDTLSFLHML